VPRQPEGSDAAAGPAHAIRTLTGRIRRSFIASVGSIVFGMEDGTVSIFGLVFGVAAAAPDSRAVLLAGGTGAVAAAVSMMAGAFLDVESTNDQAAARLAQARAYYEAHQHEQHQILHGRMISAGLSDSEAEAILGVVSKRPGAELNFAAAAGMGASEVTRKNPFVQATWMFSTDLFAASVPVTPFAFLALTTARIVSLLVTLVLLIFLGIGRGMIGRRRILPTVAETIVIAAAAAAAGVGVGKLIA